MPAHEQIEAGELRRLLGKSGESEGDDRWREVVGIGLEIKRRLRHQHQRPHDDADREGGAEEACRKLAAAQPDDRQRQQQPGDQNRRQGGERRDQRRVHHVANAVRDVAL